MDVMNQVTTYLCEKILESDDSLSLTNHDKLQLIRNQTASALKYIDIFCEKSLPAGIFSKLISQTNLSDLSGELSLDNKWKAFLWNCKESIESINKPIGFNYRTAEPPLLSGEFDKTILIDHALKDIGEYFYNTLIYYISVLSLDDTLKKQCISLVRIREHNARMQGFLDQLNENIDRLSPDDIDISISKIYAVSDGIKSEVGLPRSPYCQYHTKTVFEEYLLKRFMIISDNINPSYIVNNFSSNSVEFFLRQRPMQRVEVIREKRLLKKFFSNYKKSKYNYDNRYWASSLKRDIIKEIFEFHGLELLKEESLKEIGIDSEWLAPKYQDLYYKTRGLFNCIDEMIVSKNCNIRYLAATAMPYNDPRFKLLIQDRSKKVFLIALEKCSIEHLTFMLTSKKISGNSAKLIIQRRLGA